MENIIQDRLSLIQKNYRYTTIDLDVVSEKKLKWATYNEVFLLVFNIFSTVMLTSVALLSAFDLFGYTSPWGRIGLFIMCTTSLITHFSNAQKYKLLLRHILRLKQYQTENFSIDLLKSEQFNQALPNLFKSNHIITFLALVLFAFAGYAYITEDVFVWNYMQLPVLCLWFTIFYLSQKEVDNLKNNLHYFEQSLEKSV